MQMLRSQNLGVDAHQPLFDEWSVQRNEAIHNPIIKKDLSLSFHLAHGKEKNYAHEIHHPQNEVEVEV